MGILESYVIKSRRDGAERNALMRERINRLVCLNTKILTLLDGYGHHNILTNRFMEGAKKFRGSCGLLHRPMECCANGD
jgi:hypothetical protein